MRQAHTMPIETPDPVVGDMTCAPAMSIHSLLESMGQPMPSDCQPNTAK